MDLSSVEILKINSSLWINTLQTPIEGHLLIPVLHRFQEENANPS